MSMSRVRATKRRASGVPGGRELPDADPHLVRRELTEERVDHEPGEALDEVDALAGSDLDDAAGDRAVVDRRAQVVGERRGPEVEGELGVDREPGAHRLLGLRQAVLAVEPHILEEELVRHQSLTTGFLRIPMDSIRTSTRSPGRSGPTPAGVPVVITSPGSSVITWETRATRSSIGKTISLVLED